MQLKLIQFSFCLFSARWTSYIPICPNFLHHRLPEKPANKFNGDAAHHNAAYDPESGVNRSQSDGKPADTDEMCSL